MKESIFIVGGKRSAVAKYGGGLADLPATEITALVIKDILKTFPISKSKIDEVIIGNVLSAGLGQNPARITAVKAGLSHEIPAYVVNKVCGSGLKSVILGIQSILLDEAELILAGGMENMSRAPFLLENCRFGTKIGHQFIKDSMVLDGLHCSLIDMHMGMTAENIAEKYKMNRKSQDMYALKSHQKALRAQKAGKFTDEIAPIKISRRGKTAVFSVDEQPRQDTSFEKLQMLKPVFKKNGTVTAGNAASLNDGAAMVLLASEKMLSILKKKPLARIVCYETIGTDPAYMGLGSYYAGVECLKKAGFSKNDIDLWEINEAFASQSLAVIKQLGVDPEKVNVNGGAIALGHPIGASGARILVTLLHELKRQKLRYGMASLCIGGGQGIALLVENLNR